jgi:hypothetical protein
VLFASRSIARRRFHFLGALVVPLLLSCGAIGCTPRGDETAPVSGVVEYDGKPLSGFKNAAVVLTPKGGRLATGTISPTDGTFELSTYEDGDGAVVGPATLSVTATIDDPNAGKIEGRHQPVKFIIPEKFGDRDTSGLSYEVMSDENFLRIKLASDGTAVIETE